MQQPDAPATKRRIEFGEGDEVLGPIRGVMDNGKNPSLPYAAAVGAVPLDLKGELYQVRRPLRVRLKPHAPYACPPAHERVAQCISHQQSMQLDLPAS